MNFYFTMKVVKVMDNEKFGKFLNEARKEKGLTQKELAGTLKVTDKAVSKWERGKSYPDISLLEPLSKVLNISVVELLKGEKTNKKENEDLILNAINLYKEETKKKLKKKRKNIFIASFITFFIILGLILLVWQTSKPKYSEEHAFTQFYIPNTGNIKGELDIEEFISISPDFAIGANQYGYAVFIDPDKAFARLIKDYKTGINLIKEEFKLGSLTKNNFVSYEIYGAQVTTGTDKEKGEARFISRVLDIYENSFSIDTLNKMLFH